MNRKKIRRQIRKTATSRNIGTGIAAIAAATALLLVRRKLWYRANAKPAMHDPEHLTVLPPIPPVPQAQGNGGSAEPLADITTML
jgi:hypothetical protein